MEGKRNRGEVTAELSEKVWARLCRENALVASEVWVDDARRVDFVAYRPHRPRDRSSNHATAAELESGTFTFVEVKSCMDDFTSGHGRTFEGDENWLVCPLELADSLASKGMLPKGAAVYSPDARGALRKRYDTSEFRQVRVAPAIELIWAMLRRKSSRAYLPKDTLVLCANNRIADSINRENVDALDAPKVEFAAAATGTVSNGDKMAPERIVLCRGARVMSLVNSPQEGYVNGTQGTVTDASADAVTVKFDGVDEKVRIERHRWEINKSEAVVEMDDEGRPVNRVKTAVVGTYTQIPLKLAYAITIHKSQGLTFDACCVHTKVFAEGQLYVGLSRVRSAAGLTVFPKIEPNRLIASREVVEFYDSLERRMEEPVQIECPRRFESQVRAYIRDLMAESDILIQTPPSLEDTLEG